MGASMSVQEISPPKAKQRATDCYLSWAGVGMCGAKRKNHLEDALVKITNTHTLPLKHFGQVE